MDKHFTAFPKYKHNDMKPTKGTVGKALQENCKDLKVLLVDERSRIGASTLGWMGLICRRGVSSGQC